MALPAEPAVFLDRDGVLNEAIIRDGKPYPPRDLGEFAITPDARAALSRLKARVSCWSLSPTSPMSRAVASAVRRLTPSTQSWPVVCHSTRSRFASTTTRNIVTAASRSPA